MIALVLGIVAIVVGAFDPAVNGLDVGGYVLAVFSIAYIASDRLST